MSKRKEAVKKDAKNYANWIKRSDKFDKIKIGQEVTFQANSLTLFGSVIKKQASGYYMQILDVFGHKHLRVADDIVLT